jgi:hypothetical protein
MVSNIKMYRSWNGREYQHCIMFCGSFKGAHVESEISLVSDVSMVRVLYEKFKNGDFKKL